MALVPPLEQVIVLLKDQYAGRVAYEPIEKRASTYTQFTDIYAQWYERKYNIPVIIKASDGATIKWLINTLRNLSGSEEEAVIIWQLIFDKWTQLEDWYQAQTDLLQIKKNINIILKQVKYGKSTSEKGRNAKNVADDYRQKL